MTSPSEVDCSNAPGKREARPRRRIQLACSARERLAQIRCSPNILTRTPPSTRCAKARFSGKSRRAMHPRVVLILFALTALLGAACGRTALDSEDVTELPLA